MVEPAHAVGELPRACLRVGGVSLARHQLGLALALGCQRIVCLSAIYDAELGVLQQVAEAGGANFQRISGAAGLLGLVNAGDELVALGEAMLVWPELAIAQLNAGPVVLVQPIEAGLAAGFERMDINHASAGAMLIPGRVVARLAEFPADFDVFSTLQRLALQAGVPQRLLPPDAHEAGRWSLVRGEAEAHAVEMAWIRLHTQTAGAGTLALDIARRGVRAFGPALLHAGSSGTVVAIAGGVAQAFGLVLGWFGLVVPGLALFGAAWVLFLAASLFGRVERAALRLPRPHVAPVVIYGWVIDIGLALLMAWNMSPGSGRSFMERSFAPMMLLGLTRMVARVMGQNSGHWIEDRLVLALVLAIAAIAGGFSLAIGALALAVLVAGTVITSRQNAANASLTPTR